jgi:hypothetical protein
MNVPNKRWLAIVGICGSCIIATCDLLAALSLTTSSNAVSIPILITDYNPSTGVAQVTKTSAHSMTVLSTTSTWTVTARALTTNFSFAPSLGDPNPNKPASKLAIRVPILATTWYPLSTTPQVIATGARSNVDQTGSLDYRIDSSLTTDPPGNYSLTIIYTITSP